MVKLLINFFIIFIWFQSLNSEEIYGMPKIIDGDTVHIKSKKIIVEVDKKYFRPLEVDKLLGDNKKASRVLKWKPKIRVNDLIDEMIIFEKKKIIND